MSLFCDAGGYDTDGADWWWYQPADEAPLATKRSRKCCSCGQKVGVGETARKILRFRPPTEFEETRGIHGDEVPMPDWYLCEACGDLADSLAELGFCYHLGGGESLKQQIAEYRETEAAEREWQKTHNAKSQATDAALSRQVACTDGLGAAVPPAPTFDKEIATMQHELKTDPEVFQAMIDGGKTYELRKDDRGFRVGDTLTLRETKYTGEEMHDQVRAAFPFVVKAKPLEYTGRTTGRVVTHILRGPIYGLAEGWAILSCK